MGKTLGAIIAIGAAVAINVIPGAGQVISGTIFAGLASVTGTVGLAASAALTFSQVAALAITTGLTINGLQSLGGVLGLGPSAPKPDTTETALKTSRPPRTSAYGVTRLYGAYILYETATDGTAIDVYAIHDGQLTEIVQHYLADDTVTPGVGGYIPTAADGQYGSNKVQVFTTTGATPGTAISAVTAKLPTIWTADHRGDGVVQMAVLSASVKSADFLEVYPNGVPVASLAAKWQKCPDPRAADPMDEASWTWTENSIRQLMHYMIVRENVDYATKIAPALDYWKSAADVCDQAIALKEGGTEPRWRSCVAHKHTDAHASVKSAIMLTCDGWLATRSDGAFVVYAGQYYAPIVSIGPDEIIAFQWEGVGVDDDTAINEIICSYVSAAHDYNSVETTAWRDENDIAERGEILTDSLEPQCPSYGQVRRLAKRQMSRRNALYRGTVTTNVSGRIVRGERYIHLTLSEAGTTFFDGPAEITAVTRNMSTGGVTFSWSAADPNIDSWNPATEQGEPAPVGNRVAPQPLETPTISDAQAELGDDGSSARVRITVEGFDRSDIIWFARWRVTTDTTWNEQEYSDIEPGPAAVLLTSVVPINVAVDVEVAYQTGDGRISNWSAVSTVSTSTSALIPHATIVDGGGTTVTVASGGLFQISKVSGSGWDASAVSSTSFAGSAVAEIHAPASGADVIAGLSPTPGAADDYFDIPYAVYFAGGGALYAAEAGALTAIGTWAPGDVLWVVQAPDGSTISYRKGAALSTSALLRSLPVATTNLYFDSSISDVGRTFIAGLFRRSV